MGATDVIRVDAEIVQAAKDVGEIQGRSAASQVSHWARLGRAIENADVSTSAIHDVLAHQAEFDSLSDTDQRVVSAMWDHRIQERIANTNLKAEFHAAGTPYAELDDEGNAVIVRPSDTR